MLEKVSIITEEKVMSIKYLSEPSFKEKVLKAKQPVLVDFCADWCAPCRALAPVLEDLAVKHADKVKIAKVDVDQNGDLAAKYRVCGVPAMIVFKNGEEQNRIVGFFAKEQLSEYLTSLA